MNNSYTILIIFLSCILLVTSVSMRCVEHFEEDIEKTKNQSILVKTRECEMHLTNDAGVCNKLDKYYKMGHIQLQITINNMKSKKDASSQQAYNILKYIQSKKKNIPINACKISIPDLSEIDSIYQQESKYPYKSITSLIDYDPVTFKGYCLLDTQYDTDEVSVKMKVNKELSDIMNSDRMIMTSQIKDIGSDETTYAALEFNNDIFSKILNNPKKFCKKSSNNIDIQHKAIFVRITCNLESFDKISASKVELVEYNKESNSFIKVEKYQLSEKTEENKSSVPIPDTNTDKKDVYQPDSENIMKIFENAFFGFNYIENGALTFSSYNIPVSMFTFQFDICQNVESYVFENEITDPSDDSKKNKIQFSFREELGSTPKIIKQQLNIPFLDNTKNISESEDVKITDNKDNDISNLIDDKIKKLGNANEEIKNKIKEYDDSLDKTAKNYIKLQESCSNNEDTYSTCIEKANIDFGNLYKLITISKSESNNIIQRNKSIINSLTDVKEIMSKTRYSIEDANEEITNNIPKNNDGTLKYKGVPFSFQKFAKYISNDDCLYFRFDY